MYRERALLKFKRYYYHGISDGLSSEEAGTEAMWKTRKEILDQLKEDDKFKDEREREEVWADILIQLMVFRMMLSDVPIDVEALRKRKEETGSTVSMAAPDSESPTAVLTEVVSEGLKQVTGENGHAS